MQQVELADGNEQDASSEVKRFVHQIVNMRKFQADFIVTGFSDAVLDLNFRCELYVLGNIGIDNGTNRC